MADGVYEPFPPVEAWASVAFDPALYDEHAARLDTARAAATEEARDRAVRTAIRYAGTDTGAIEGLYTTDRGFTRSVAIEAAAWEAAAEERGPNAAEIIKDQIAAYEWVLDLVTQKVPVTEHVIRELHAMLCRSQETYVVHTELGRQERPLPKGEYKAFPNNPTLASGRVHHYAPPDDVPAEMHRLVASLATPEYEALHPVVQAAYLHYALAAIHPFADGNGRASRALASVPLYRDRRVPLVIFADDRDEYLDALEAADAGDLGAFVAFVAERVVDAIGLVVATIAAGDAADGAGSIEALRRAAAVAEGRSNAELDALAHRLLDAAREELLAHVASLDLPGETAFECYNSSPSGAPPNGFRHPTALPGGLLVAARAPAPSHAGCSENIGALIATGAGHAPFVLLSATHQAEFTFRDLDPAIRQVARIRIAAFVSTVVSHMLAHLARNL